MTRVGLAVGYVASAQVFGRAFEIGVMAGGAWTRWSRDEVAVARESAAVTRTARDDDHIGLSGALLLGTGRLGATFGVDLGWPDGETTLTPRVALTYRIW